MAGDPTEFGDLHSHLVPGVDDGAQVPDDSVEGIGRMRDAGFVRIVTTPHLEASLTLNPGALEARFDEVASAWEWVRPGVERDFPEIEVQQGFEVALDVPEPDLSDPRLRLGDTSFILVEWPRMHVPPQSARVLTRLRLSGLRPIIAHPERYFGLDPDLAVVAGWKSAGAFLQVNNGSLVGRYGADARAVAHRLLRRGMVDYLSTDFHGRSHLKLYKEEVEERMASLGGSEQFDLLASVNPLRLFRDEEPFPVPPLDEGRGIWDRLRGMFTGT